jgi:cob(I)alamin adenosyltransferase
VKLERTRDNVFELTGTAQELSALVGAARMSLEAMEQDDRAPTELVDLLRRILREYDASLERLD